MQLLTGSTVPGLGYLVTRMLNEGVFQQSGEKVGSDLFWFSFLIVASSEIANSSSGCQDFQYDKSHFVVLLAGYDFKLL